MIDHVRVAVKALIPRHEGEVLLVRRSPIPGSANPLRYNPPGGAIQPGETLLAALKREVLEETTLEITVDGIVGIRQWEAPRHKAAYVGIFFACRLISSPAVICLNDENCEYIWADSTSITSLPLMDSSAGMVKEFLSRSSDTWLPYIESAHRGGSNNGPDLAQ